MKRSDFVRICPILELKPGEMGVIISSSFKQYEGGWIVAAKAEPPCNHIFILQCNGVSGYWDRKDDQWNYKYPEVGVLPAPESVEIEP